MWHRRPWFLVFLGALALLTSACGKGGGPQAGGAQTAPDKGGSLSVSPTEVYTATVSGEGATIAVPASDPAIPGVTITIPAGATAAGTTVTLAGEASSAPLTDLAAASPDVFRAVTDWVATLDPALAHPLYTPYLVVATAQPAGPALRLGPDGTTFAAPVEVTVPVALLGLGAGERPLVLQESADGTWEVATDVALDEAAGVLRVPVSHFSGLRIFTVVKNVFLNPTSSVSPERVAAAVKTLEQGPLPQVVEGLVRRIGCAEEDELHAGAGNVPTSVVDLLNYLGRDAGEIGNLPDGVLDDLESLVETERQAQLAKGNRAPHSVTLARLLDRALELTKGDVFQALAAVHGTLRDNRPQSGQAGDPFGDTVELLRGDGVDEAGARYHLVGMAIYSFAYEYLLSTGKLPPLATSPETTARLEEAWVSGDIATDTVEYAVDLEGAKLGRKLFEHFYAQATGGKSTIVAEECALGLQGELDLADFADELTQVGGTVLENRVELTLEPAPEEGEGAYHARGELAYTIEIPGSVLYAIAAGLGEAIGGAVFGGEDGSTDEIDVPPEYEDCQLMFTVGGPVEASVVPGGLVVGTAEITSETSQAGCEDTDLDVSALSPPVHQTADWQGSYDGTKLEGTFPIPDLEGKTTGLSFTATPRSP